MIRGEEGRKKEQILAKKKVCKEEVEQKGKRKMEGLICGIIAQTHYNFARNKNGGKMALGELKGDVNPLPGSNSVLSLPESHTSTNSCKTCVLTF